jgi:tetratricopeptide (TPR) repeat protein
MTSKKLPCFWLCLLMVMNGCAQLSTSGGWMEPKAPPRSPIDSQAEADAYYDYLLGQHYLRNNQVDQAVEAYNRALQKDPQSAVLLTELAALYVRQGKIDAALKVTEDAAAYNPGYNQTYMMLGQLYAGSGQNTKAINTYKQLLEKTPADGDVYLLLGTLYAQEGRYAEAMEIFDRLQHLYPDNPMALYYKARVFLDMKLYDQAETAYREVVMAEPSFENALLDLGYVYEVTERNKAAEETYLRILSFSSGSIQANTRLGNLYMREGKLEEALQRFRNRKDAESRLKIGIIHLQQKNYEDAIEDFTDLLQEEPQYDQALYYLGTTYEEKGETQQAIVHLRTISRNSPLWTAAQIRLALIFSKLKDYRSGQEVLNEAIAKRPDLPDLYLYTAVLYEDEKKYDEALDILDKGLEKAPNDADLLFRKGALLDKMGKKNEAIAVMRKILETDPKNANTLNYIGYTYADLGINLVEARQLIKTALEIEPEDGYIMDSMAWVYYRMGQPKKALDIILEAIKRVPKDPVMHEHLGDIYLTLGKKSEAAGAYHKALEYEHTEPDKIQEKLKGLP